MGFGTFSSPPPAPSEESRSLPGTRKDRGPVSLDTRIWLLLPAVGLALLSFIAVVHVALTAEGTKGASSSPYSHHTSGHSSSMYATRSSAALRSKRLIPPSVNRINPESIAKVSLEKLDSLPLTSGAPHIVYIMVDDAGLNDLVTGDRQAGESSSSSSSSSSLATSWSSDQYIPNMKALAEDGITLSRYYGMHLCTPARGAFLTGRHPIHLGLQHDVILPTHTWGLDPSVALLPQMLASANYTSHIVGKWHLGHAAKSFLPTERGFDSFFGYLTDQIDYYDKTYPYAIEGGYYKDFFFGEPGKLQAVDIDPSELTTVLWVSRAKEIITAHATTTTASSEEEEEEEDGNTQPLFLYFSVQNNHSPLVDVDESLLSSEQLSALGAIDEAKSLGRYRYTKLNMMLDNAVGEIVETLKANGMYKNSILVVASDNGACYESGGSNYPYRGTKHNLFEGGVRVPAFVHSPLLPESSRGVSYPHLFSIMDWAPTFLHLAGLHAPPDLDGVNHWEALTSFVAASPASSSSSSSSSFPSSPPPREELLINYDAYETTSTKDGGMQERSAPIGAIMNSRYKLLVNEFNVSWYRPDMYDYSVGDHAECVDVYSTAEQADVLLFDLLDDPYESRELQDSYPEVVSELWARLDVHRSRAMVPYFTGVSDSTCIATWQQFGNYIVPWKDDDTSYITGPSGSSSSSSPATWR